MLHKVQVVGVVPEPAAEIAGSRVGPKRQEALFAQVVVVLDVVVLVASFFLAYALRDRFIWYGELLPLRDHLWVLAIIVVLWPALARRAGLTDSQTYLWPRRVFMLTARVHVIGGLGLLSMLYLLRAVAVSRLFIQTFLFVSAIAIAAERTAIRRRQIRAAAGTTPFQRRTIVIGTTPEASRFQRLLKMRPHWGSEITGFLVTDGPSAQYFGTKPILGRIHDLDTLLDTMIVDDIVLAAPVAAELVDQVARASAERGLTFHTLVHMPASVRARHHAEALGGGLYLMSLEQTPQHVAPLLVKRAIDIAVSLVGLVPYAIAYGICAPLIKLTSPGPAIFKQTRVGKNGRFFTMYKFRTMHCDAEAQKATLAAANEMRGHVFKLGSDPRVTPIGRKLRRLYLDELPQCWNVLKGDMSLVGPRPPLPEEVTQYSPYHRRRLSVRPGITGPWQTKGNGTVPDFEEVVRIECDYIDQWTLWSDFQILLHTCVTVIRMAGH
jgi:exopolysaccharide biosynthesis polyprenyl glycosylphosphotransferase